MSMTSAAPAILVHCEHVLDDHLTACDRERAKLPFVTQRTYSANRFLQAVLALKRSDGGVNMITCSDCRGAVGTIVKDI